MNQALLKKLIVKFNIWKIILYKIVKVLIIILSKLTHRSIKILSVFINSINKQTKQLIVIYINNWFLQNKSLKKLSKK